MILHICPKKTWAEALKEGEYRGDTLSTEGFIHCSNPEQVVEVADYMFNGISDLILLVIDEARVIAEVKYEDAGNNKLYPHIYGPLNLNAVAKIVDFPVKANGGFELPDLH